MLFTRDSGNFCDRPVDDTGFAEYRLPVFFTLLVAREQVVDADSWARLAKRLPKHERSPRCAPSMRGHKQSCTRCRDSDAITKMADHGPVRLLPFSSEVR